eukprot:TRINITY_DN18899_c0_g1_i1.p1 TRINITY_DN18899_c0_g1~~TRINITY_DN18899_c0_g1_i1.p1  ORF type:complete len:400 (+),score=47.13 TRINITY_DN18899_c0_g1_i1:42-1241(+)
MAVFGEECYTYKRGDDLCYEYFMGFRTQQECVADECDLAHRWMDLKQPSTWIHIDCGSDDGVTYEQITACVGALASHPQFRCYIFKGCTIFRALSEEQAVQWTDREYKEWSFNVLLSMDVAKLPIPVAERDTQQRVFLIPPPPPPSKNTFGQQPPTKKWLPPPPPPPPRSSDSSSASNYDLPPSHPKSDVQNAYGRGNRRSLVTTGRGSTLTGASTRKPTEPAGATSNNGFGFLGTTTNPNAYQLNMRLEQSGRVKKDEERKNVICMNIPENQLTSVTGVLGSRDSCPAMPDPLVNQTVVIGDKIAIDGGRIRWEAITIGDAHASPSFDVINGVPVADGEAGLWVQEINATLKLLNENQGWPKDRVQQKRYRMNDLFRNLTKLGRKGIILMKPTDPCFK